MTASIVSSRVREELRRLFGREEADLLLAAASARADRVAPLLPESAGASHTLPCLVVGEVLGKTALERRWEREEVVRLVDALVEASEAPAELVALELYGRALEAARNECLPPRLAIEAALHLLVAFAPVADVSVWTLEQGASPVCVSTIGGAATTRRARAAARETIATGLDRQSERGSVHAVALLRWQRPQGALVVRARPSDSAKALVFAGEAAPALSCALERAFLLERSSAREQHLVSASERRLTRLGFDIHDGPIQDIAALAADLRLFRSQLASGLLDSAPSDIRLGRLDDFNARLVALDSELRELAHSLERTSALECPFPDTLRRLVAAFEERNEVSVRVQLRGDSELLTPSQRLAMLALVREALVNVREHSGARTAQVRVTIGPTHAHVTVSDDGRGFDAERTLARAERRGRLGLLGMSQRIRMLGGLFDVESRPGGPTRVHAAVPRWDGVPAELASALSA